MHGDPSIFAAARGEKAQRVSTSEGVAAYPDAHLTGGQAKARRDAFGGRRTRHHHGNAVGKSGGFDEAAVAPTPTNLVGREGARSVAAGQEADEHDDDAAVPAHSAQPTGGGGGGGASVVAAGAFVAVSITDIGSGIPEELQGQIFEPFFTTKGVGKGTGLGLHIVRRLLQRHEGEIAVESRPGRTEFQVRLPKAAS